MRCTHLLDEGIVLPLLPDLLWAVGVHLLLPGLLGVSKVHLLLAGLGGLLLPELIGVVGDCLLGRWVLVWLL